MTRFARYSIAAALVLAVSGGPAFGQEPSPEPTPAPAQEPTPPPAVEPTPAPPSTAAALQSGPGTAADTRPTLALSLQETVARALENNADIAVDRLNPEMSAENVRELRGVYEPVAFSTITQNSRTSPASNVFAGAENVNTDTLTYNLGATQNFPTGGNLRLDFNNDRQDTNSIFETFNPSFGSALTLNLQQPLLRNLRIDPDRYQIRVAQRNRDISETQFQQTVLNTQASVKQLYYDLIYAIDNLEAQRKSLALATKLVEENRIKVRVGTMAPLDVVAAEAEQASREEAVILAENALLEAEDALKREIFPKNDPATWNLRIVPTERPTADPVAVDLDAAIQAALLKRTDLTASRYSLENAEYGVKFARNQMLPAIDLVAAYGSTGIGGTQIIRDDPPFGEVTGTVPGGFGDALGNVFGRDFPTWTLGVNVNYPILNRRASAAHARARLSRDQAQANLRRAELQVASEVRSAGRAVETNYKRVESTRAARVLAERRLDAEEKKFAAGLSTNFLVTQAQRDLALAEVAQLRAVADYSKSLVNFERVQQAGGGVSFSAAPLTASRATSTTGSSTGGGPN
jgi:outer membrane protein